MRPPLDGVLTREVGSLLSISALNLIKAFSVGCLKEVLLTRKDSTNNHEGHMQKRAFFFPSQPNLPHIFTIRSTGMEWRVHTSATVAICEQPNNHTVTTSNKKGKKDTHSLSLSLSLSLLDLALDQL
jgi:hypothetical protein